MPVPLSGGVVVEVGGGGGRLAGGFLLQPARAIRAAVLSNMVVLFIVALL
jgi:hypothetical protein